MNCDTLQHLADSYHVTIFLYDDKCLSMEAILLLPVLSIPAIYHIGKLKLVPTVRPRDYVKNIDFELGMLSVSQDPEVWREGWAGDEANIFELRTPSGDLQFLDIDRLDENQRNEMSEILKKRGLLSGTTNLEATISAYSILNLTERSTLPVAARTPSDVAFEIATAAALSGSQRIHGIWWNDVWAGMRGKRGGIFQNALPRVDAAIVSKAQSHAISGASLREIQL